MGVLEKPIYYLLEKERFYANFLLDCEIVLSDKNVKRAAFSFRNNSVQFYFNEEYFNSIPVRHQAGVIKHEIQHLMLDHLKKRKGDILLNPDADNIAKDCATNQMNKDLPDDCVTLEYVEKICGKKLKPLQCYEYYYEQMKDCLEKVPKISYHSDHQYMDESEYIEQIKEAIIKDKVNKAIKSSGGNIPDGLQGIISEINKPPQINWKQQLRNLIASSRSITTTPSRMKVHRRFELDQPGKKKNRELILGVCTDSSGSVSDASYASFLNEIKSISKNTKITYLVHADCEVQKVDTIRNGRASGDVLKKRHGNGGTAYSPAIKKCTELECDAIVYFGDMDSADTPENPKIPFIWAIVGNQSPPANFGKIVRIKEND